MQLHMIDFNGTNNFVYVVHMRNPHYKYAIHPHQNTDDCHHDIESPSLCI